MTEIEPSLAHRRKPEWRFYLCDWCFQNFWAPAESVVRFMSGRHQCERCSRSDPLPLGMRIDARRLKPKPTNET